jgi:hypothetical protein
MFYGLAGLACGRYEAHVTVTNTVTTIVFIPEFEIEVPVTTTTTASTSAAGRLWGLVLGFGIETEDMMFDWPVRWGLEYRFTNFETWRFAALGQDFVINPDVHEIRLRLVVPFNALQ